MRVIFMGTPDFAVPSLEQLLRHGHEVCAVYTQPDKPKGRGHKLQPPPVKELALPPPRWASCAPCAWWMWARAPSSW